MDSGAADNMVTKNSFPLSHYTTTLVYHPATCPTGESTMDIFVPQNKKRVNGNNDPAWKDDRDPLWFYKDPTFSHPGLRINYIPLCMTSTAVSNSSQSKVSFPFPSSKLKVSSRSYIHDDVALSILKKLSIKSLKRFRCVCKSWSILFENTDFLTTYRKYFISRHGSDDDYHTFIFTNHCEYKYDYPFYHSEFHLIEKRLKLNLPSPVENWGMSKTCILGSASVNGIFCLCREVSYFTPVRYILWDPLTKESMIIPSSPAQLTCKFPRTNICHDMQYIFQGFGYDQLRDDFKIIQYVSFNSREWDRSSSWRTSKCFFETYSVKSKSWTMIDMEKDLDQWGNFPTMPFVGLEVYVDGAYHWLATKKINNQYATTMLSFDLSDEVFLTTPIGVERYSPPYIYDLRLTVLNRSIALISKYPIDNIFDIFILGELGVSESWIKLYTCELLPSFEWLPFEFGKMGYIFGTNKYNKVAYVDLSTQIMEDVGITYPMYTNFIFGLYKESKPSLDRRIK